MWKSGGVGRLYLLRVEHLELNRDCSSEDLGSSHRDISKYIFMSCKVFTEPGYMLGGTESI